jgi:shikimate dehydrogenase
MPPKTATPQPAAAPVSSPTLFEKCCLIAQPVAGNPTHFMIEQALALSGLDWRFMSFEVAAERLGDAMRGIRALGIRGVKVAEPHQETVLEYLDDLSEPARRCGSVNYVTYDGTRLRGDNTEGTALVELIEEHGELKEKSALVMGSGRLARALAMALGQAGVASITVASRSAKGAQRVLEMLQVQRINATSVEYSEKKPLKVDSAISVLVNATPLSTLNPSAALPLDVTAAGSEGIVVDVAYNSPSTWLTRAAAKRGCHVITGVELYVRQTSLALTAWTGAPTDMVALTDAAEEFLGL